MGYRQSRPQPDSTGLGGLARLPGWLEAAQPERLRAGLAAALDEVAQGRLVIDGCDPRHFRQVDGTWTFQCRVTTSGPAGEPSEVWLEATLHPPGTPRVVPLAPAAAFGSEGWRCALPELGVDLRTAAADTSLPMMSRLTDAERARVLLEDAIRAGSPAHAELRIRACRPQVMRYARGSRCTVRYELDHDGEANRPDWPDVVVAKTYRGAKGENAYQGMRALWNSELSRSSAVVIAEPLAYLAAERVLVQGPVAEERTLKELIGTALREGTPAALDELDVYVARTAVGLAALHGCGVAWGETVTLEGEVAEIRSRIERLARLGPEISGAAAPLLDRVLELAAAHPAGPARPSHGTFRPAQVLLHRGTVGFIDFDDFGQAEPALDVARFRAGIRDCWMRSHVADDGSMPGAEATTATMTAVGAVCDRFLCHYEAVAPVSRERVMLWETLDLLTDVIHGWTRMSPGRLLGGMLTLDDHLRRSGLFAAPARPAAPRRSATGLGRPGVTTARRVPTERRRPAATGLGSLATLPEWLPAAAGPDGLRAGLTAAVPEIAEGHLVLHECRTKHFRLGTATWTFLCRVTVAAAGAAAEPREVLLEGTLHPPGTPLPAAGRRAEAFGSEGWHCALPELGVELRAAPPDAALPLVPRLTDPEQARTLLEAAIRGGAPEHAGLRIAGCRPRVMRHDRGSRCTVRYELDHPRGAAGPRRLDVVVAKTYRDGRGENAYQGMRALWSSELSRSYAVVIAEPLAYLPELRLLVQGRVPGERTMEDLIGTWLHEGSPVGADELDDHLARVAEGLAALHGCGVTLGGSVALEQEAAGLRALLERLGGPLPQLAGAAAPLLARVLDLSAERPAGPIRPSHGTFRPTQVLVHHGGVGFIDFDGFCQAEPALDLARFRAGIKDAGMRTLLAAGDRLSREPGAAVAALTALEAVCDGFLRHYEALAPVSRDRVQLWETLDLLTAVLHAWTRPSQDRLRARMLTLEEHVRGCGLMAVAPRSTAPARVAAPDPRAA